MKKKNKCFSIRIDTTMYEELVVLSEKNFRSINHQIEKILFDYLKDYKRRNGPIIEEEPIKTNILDEIL